MRLIYTFPASVTKHYTTRILRFRGAYARIMDRIRQSYAERTQFAFEYFERSGSNDHKL